MNSSTSDAADCAMDEALGAAELDCAVAGRSRRFRDHRLEELLDRLIQLEAHAPADHRDRLGEPDVAGDRPVSVALLELLGRVADAEAQVDVLSEADHVDNAAPADRLDGPSTRRSPRRGGCRRESPARYPSRARDPRGPGGVVDRASELRIPTRRIGELLAGRHDAHSRIDAGEQRPR